MNPIIRYVLLTYLSIQGLTMFVLGALVGFLVCLWM